MSNKFNRSSISYKKNPNRFIKNKYTDNRQDMYQIVSYYGGKYQLTPRLLKEIAELKKKSNYITNYAELCGGGARTLLNLPDGSFEKKIYNEYSVGLCKLFASVRDKELCEILIGNLRKLPYNREVFEFAKDNMDNRKFDIIKGAILTYIAIMQSRNSDMKNFKLGKEDYTNNRIIERYYKKISRIERCTCKLKNVEILCGDCFSLIKNMKKEWNILAYIDPPYHPITRADGAKYVYPYEMTIEQHQELVALLLETQMTVILSGYDPAQYGCNDYDLLNKSNGWEKKSMGYVYRPSSNKSGYSSKKEEFIWIKHPSR